MNSLEVATPSPQMNGDHRVVPRNARSMRILRQVGLSSALVLVGVVIGASLPSSQQPAAVEADTLQDRRKLTAEHFHVGEDAVRKEIPPPTSAELVPLPDLSSPSLQRFDVVRGGNRALQESEAMEREYDASVTHILSPDGRVQCVGVVGEGVGQGAKTGRNSAFRRPSSRQSARYETFTELVGQKLPSESCGEGCFRYPEDGAPTLGEFAGTDGRVGARVLRLRVVSHMEGTEGDEFYLTPIGLSLAMTNPTANTTLAPNLFYFSYVPAGASVLDRDVGMVSLIGANGEPRFFMGEGRASRPHVEAWARVYNAAAAAGSGAEGRSRALIDGAGIGGAVGGAVGGKVGGSIGGDAGGAIGGAVGGAIAGPVGAAAGEEIGHMVGHRVGEAIGERVGERVGRGIGSRVGRACHRGFSFHRR